MVLAITDHARRLTMARGLTPDRLSTQLDEIDWLNRSLTDIRLLKGIEVDILEDGALDLPSGVLGRREPYDVDLSRINRKARERGCFLEVNAHPERLDLTDLHCRMAREAGVLLAVNSDAHSTGELDDRRYGIGQARRGWLQKSDVLNTRSYAEVTRLLRRTMEP